MPQRIACPKCSTEGHTKPNMAVYEDGGKHCFRCEYHEKGDSREDYKIIGPNRLNWSIEENDKRFVDGITNKFTPEALAYLYKFRINDEEISQYQIGFIEKGYYGYCAERDFPIENHLYFPILGKDDEPLGFQTKCIDPTQKIKSLTSKYNGIYATNNYISHYDHNLFIVEGIIDAICCTRMDDYSHAIALLGSSIGETKMLSILKQKPGANHIYLWMDNDTAGEKNREKIASFFEIYTGLKVKHIRTEKDPKHYNPQQIKEIING